VTSSINQSNLLDFLVKDDDITWQSILMDAVKEGELDPWDIDIGLLAEQFLKLLRELKEMNFTLSGKVVLAAAIMLKLKSKRFLTDDIAALDRVIAETQAADEYYDEDDTDYESFADEQQHRRTSVGGDDMPLYPRTPQPRRRKVSLFDLVKALDKALEVKNRRKILLLRPAPPIKAPEKAIDISGLMDEVFQKVADHYQHKEHELFFSQLLPESTKTAKIHTFVPLLHLSNARKLELEQHDHFADFTVSMRDQQDETQPSKEMTDSDQE